MRKNAVQPTLADPTVIPPVDLLLLAGICSTLGDVPPALRVYGGEQPANQDQQVRFRTTYYFRIVDSCKIEAGKTEGGAYGTKAWHLHGA